MGQSPKGESITRLEGIEFHQGKLSFGEKYLCKSDLYTSEPTKYAEPQSILICVRAPVGVVNITDRRICIGRGLAALYPSDAIILEYGFYLLQCYKEKFETQSTGSTFKAISGDIIKNEIIPVPPLTEQQRIIGKICSLFKTLDTIAENL